MIRQISSDLQSLRYLIFASVLLTLERVIDCFLEVPPGDLEESTAGYSNTSSKFSEKQNKTKKHNYVGMVQ